MSLLILTGKIAGTGALAAGALFAGVGAGHAAPADSSPTGLHCVRLKDAPPALKHDVRTMRGLPKGSKARHSARVLIRWKAVHGQYGAKVQAAAKQLRDLRRDFIEHAPADLKADLKAARHQPAGKERRAAVKAIWDKTLAGGYGTEPQTKAQAVKDHVQACHPKRAAAA